MTLNRCITSDATDSMIKEINYVEIKGKVKVIPLKARCGPEGA